MPCSLALDHVHSGGALVSRRNAFTLKLPIGAFVDTGGVFIGIEPSLTNKAVDRILDLLLALLACLPLLCRLLLRVWA